MNERIPIFKYIFENPDDFEQIQKLHNQNQFKIEGLGLELDAIQGDSESIIRQKCIDAAEIVLKNDNNIAGVIIEETAFCINALGGLPGPFTNSFLKQMSANDLIKMIHSFDDKTAYFLSTFAVTFYKDGELEIKTFQDRLNGIIVESNDSKESNLYAFFRPVGFDKTFNLLNEKEKSQISHKNKTFKQIETFLNSFSTLKN